RRFHLLDRFQHIVQDRNVLNGRRRRHWQRFEIRVNVGKRLRWLIAVRGHCVQGWLLHEGNEFGLAAFHGQEPRRAGDRRRYMTGSALESGREKGFAAVRVAGEGSWVLCVGDRAEEKNY